MAEQPVQKAQTSGRYKVYHWDTLAGTDTGVPIRLDDFDDISIYVYGTPDTGSVALKGSPEVDSPTLYSSLQDLAGSVIAINTSGGHAVVGPKAIWYYPVVTGGGGSCDLDIWIVAV